MAGIKIALVADVAPFVAGMAKAEQSIDDTADSLDDLARDAQKQGRDAGQDIAKGIDAGTEKAERSVDDLTTSFREMARDGSRYAKDTGDDIGKSIKHGTDEASAGMEDFKGEAASTARETAASFDGSAESIAGGFQEVAANALAGFGPIGAAAGLAAAAGIGLLWTSIQEGAEKAKQQVSDAFDDMTESGNKFLSEELINQRTRDIVSGNDDAVASYDHLLEVASKTGADIGLVLRAYAGDQEASNALIDAAAAKSQDIKDRFGKDGLLSDAAREDRAELSKVIGELNGVQENTDTAAARYDAYSQSVELGNKHIATSADEARAMYDGLGREIEKLPKEVTVSVKADLTTAKRQIRELTDGTYQVLVNGNVVGRRMT